MKLYAIAAGSALLMSALAAPAHAQRSAEVYIDETGCGGFVPDAAGNDSGIFVVGRIHSVVNSAGFSKVTCHFSIPTQKRSTTATGFPCNTVAGFTSDSRLVASAGGRMVLTCSVPNARN